jgi:hypothetical protein
MYEICGSRCDIYYAYDLLEIWHSSWQTVVDDAVLLTVKTQTPYCSVSTVATQTSYCC